MKRYLAFLATVLGVMSGGIGVASALKHLPWPFMALALTFAVAAAITAAEADARAEP